MIMALRGERNGFTVIELLVVIAIVSLLLGMLLAAVQKARHTALRLSCANNMRQIAMGLHLFHSTNGHLPPGCNNWPENSTSEYKFWQLSWMALILPFIEQDPLWQQTREMETIGSSPAPCNDSPFPYDWSYPWDLCPDDTQRYAALATVLPTLSCPADSRTSESQFSVRRQRTVGLTSYLGVSGRSIASWSVNAPSVEDATSGPGVLIGTNKYDFLSGTETREKSTVGANFSDIRDGLSSTLMVGERPPSPTFDFGWWFAGIGQAWTGSIDVVLGTNELNLQTSAFGEYNLCPPGPYSFSPGSLGNVCDSFHFWSVHPGGANFAFADGSVRFLRYSAAPIMPALATRAGGEIVTVPE
jgi:prepilin-type N-terminal cleavage/methylation domain-containing protein/prepilin-type processing-associated H-X9-DG protein